MTINCLLCVEPAEVSVLYYLWYMRTGGNVLRRLMNNENGA